MNYSELKTLISYTHRQGLDAMVDTFIDLFEARANRALRCVEMEQRATSTPSSDYVPFPASFLELRNIQASTTPLEYRTPVQIDEIGTYSGTPRFYSIVGNTFQIPGASGQSIEIDYFKSIPALSVSTTTNWLIESHPDYYLTGMLHQAYVYVQDAAKVAEYEQKLLMMENDIKEADRKKRYGSGPMVVTVDG